MSNSNEPIIIIDTREGAPLPIPATIATRRAPLATGDYSLSGLENLVAVERKSHADSWGSVTGKNRNRFYREWKRMGEIVSSGGYAAVLITCTREQFENPPRADSKMNAQSVIGTYRSWSEVYSVPVIYCDGIAESTEWLIAALFAAWEQLAAKVGG